MLSDHGPHAQCHTCSLVVSLPLEPVDRLVCPRCHAPVHRRKPNSLSRTWALLAAATICYVPANLYPIMEVTSLGQSQADTILSGVFFLALHGMWPLAAIVFVASVVVPVLKIAALGALAWSVERGSQWRPRDRAMLYRIVEAVGRWSMVDVYVVTILVALVHLGSLASVEAEIGAFFFGAVVVLTMFAAQSFDPRLIWDRMRAEETEGGATDGG
ncbi:MAG: paraquat-inducible protein A [Gemmatimonas sp. SG8_23]|nr:MAG: paraquat-inducible protein A [Gemmatimonas sp. SG8_23]